MSISKVLYNSNSHEWETPKSLFNSLNAEFNFDIDVCATKGNTKCSKYFTKEESALEQEWTGVCWMNPPYGRGIIKWVKKAYESSLKGSTVVCLLPARTDTIWWHEYCEKVSKVRDIRFIKRRLRFGNAKGEALFPSVIVIFRAKEIKTSK
ncbi:DNA N-6-adenine-methyltransferase [Evansella sp. AB-P1]|uniref:DNA N-6-adenine-methyltransferase n=1 Tax=Evansella sp. AB-P1 TaxID=3037653 RepID=UPI00241F0E36|nr:DNA N-6-adenine-methyltransferase [Evansella sp. AB-P1]MDG5790142.1 DNA N-6-adenine-methyltransferase [Evansella sp. AB-P1]